MVEMENLLLALVCGTVVSSGELYAVGLALAIPICQLYLLQSVARKALCGLLTVGILKLVALLPYTYTSLTI